jgi:protein-L-isoaspartate(D-aspartate) O-methyltransferase
MTRVVRTGSGPDDYQREEFHNFRFVPLVEGDDSESE